MTRYDGNTGKFVRIPDPAPSMPLPDPLQPLQEAPENDTPSRPALPNHAGQGGRGQASAGIGGGSGIFDGLGKLFSKITKPSFEMEDFILVGIFYLLYRESGDIEFLLMAGAILFL